MKYLQQWKRLLFLLLLGLVVAGCASANGKADGKKSEETIRPAAKATTKVKGNEPVVTKQKGMWYVKLNSGYDMPVLGPGNMVAKQQDGGGIGVRCAEMRLPPH